MNRLEFYLLGLFVGSVMTGAGVFIASSVGIVPLVCGWVPLAALAVIAGYLGVKDIK